MTWDWDLWPAYIALDAESRPSVDVGSLVDSIEATYAAVGAALLPTIQRVARSLEWVLSGRPVSA